MVHKESIGRVVGDNGKTYIPTITDNHDGSFHIDFNINQEGAEQDFIEGINVNVPFVYPHIDETTGDIVFSLETFELYQNKEDFRIPFEDIKGEQGESGKLNIQFITKEDLLLNIDSLPLDTIYLINNDDTNNEKILDKIDAYVIYEDITNNNQRSLQAINSIIDLSNYYNKDEIDTMLETEISRAVAGVVAQQQSIYNVLTQGIEITESDYIVGDNTINVMSDSSVEDLKNQIYQALQEYVKESDIIFDEQTGTIRIKY